MRLDHIPRVSAVSWPKETVNLNSAPRRLSTGIEDEDLLCKLFVRAERTQENSLSYQSHLARREIRGSRSPRPYAEAMLVLRVQTSKALNIRYELTANRADSSPIRHIPVLR